MECQSTFLFNAILAMVIFCSPLSHANRRLYPSSFHDCAIHTEAPLASLTPGAVPFQWDLSNGTTIDPQHLPAHPATRLRAQEMNNVGDLLGGADTVCGAEAGNCLEHRLWFSLEEELGGGGAWGDGIDADALTHEVLGHDAHHLFDGTFGGAVEEVAGHDVGGSGDGGRKKNDVGSRGHVWESFLHRRSVLKLQRKLARRIL